MIKAIGDAFQEDWTESRCIWMKLVSVRSAYFLNWIVIHADFWVNYTLWGAGRISFSMGLEANGILWMIRWCFWGHLFFDGDRVGSFCLQQKNRGQLHLREDGFVVNFLLWSFVCILRGMMLSQRLVMPMASGWVASVRRGLCFYPRYRRVGCPSSWRLGHGFGWVFGPEL